MESSELKITPENLRALAEAMGVILNKHGYIVFETEWTTEKLKWEPHKDADQFVQVLEWIVVRGYDAAFGFIGETDEFVYWDGSEVLTKGRTLMEAGVLAAIELSKRIGEDK